MGNWKKLLAEMADDEDPRSYTYGDAARILLALGFELPARKPKGSHRIWRRADPNGNVHGTLIVGLVEKGRGTLKPPYIHDMVKTLREAGLIDQPSTQGDDDLDD